MAFFIKQNDTLPIFRFQVLATDGVTPLDLSAATTVNLVLKSKSGTTTLLKKACIVEDPATNGIVRYKWVPEDTATPGDINGEVEITWNTGDVQTIPADTYFSITIVADLG